MERIITPVTVKLTTAQSRIRSELGNFPSGPTKYTVVHRRPVASLIAPFQAAVKTTSGKVILPNAMCRFVQHPTLAKNETAKLTAQSTAVALVNRKSEKQERPTETRPEKPVLKRCLSADHLEMFQPAPAKRPFPVQIWFNRKRGPRPLVATAFWLDSPLHDSQAFVYTKLLEASQARRYLQLQSKPRKYLHLTGGCLVAVNNSPPSNRKPTIVLPPMTVKVLPAKQTSTIIESPNKIKKTITIQLPPPPALISIRAPPVTTPKTERPPTPQQDQPLELCKRREPSAGSGSSPDSPAVVTSSAPSSPLNLAVKTTVTTANITPFRRKLPIAPLNFSNGVLRNQSEPLDLATPSPTTALNKLSLGDTSPISPTLDIFRRRLLLVLQVLIGKKGMHNLGFPQASLDDVLVRYLKKAGVTPAASSEVRGNWLKFLRLCVKSEDAWKNEGWDRKTPDAILEEIYMQGKIKTEKNIV